MKRFLILIYINKSSLILKKIMELKIENIMIEIKNSIIYKIYIEWLYFKIMIFFLFFSYFAYEQLLFLVVWIVILLFQWVIEKNIHFIKSIWIFLWLWLYLINSSVETSFFVIPNKNLAITILFSIFLVPLIVYIFYGKKELWKK